MQYGDESQKSLYKDELEESPTDKKQYLIGENMMEDLLYNFNNSNIIMLHPITVNKHYIKKIKRDLRCNKQIIRLIIKAMKII